jgi:uncharacterized protein with NRDE domain
MCLVLFAFQPDSHRPLVVAANRDEFYARPAKSAHYWPGNSDDDPAHLLAGRDLTAGGTWLGVSTKGRFATVTNFAEDVPDETVLRSRGELVASFLNSNVPAHKFAHHIHGLDYRGFNLLLWDGRDLTYTSNRGTTQDIGPGVYGLSNAELGATWPKVVSGAAGLSCICDTVPTSAKLLELLTDEQIPPDDELPQRGRPLELERQAASCFIRGEDYGTRASTAVIVENSIVHFAEQEYGAGGIRGGYQEYQFQI